MASYHKVYFSLVPMPILGHLEPLLWVILMPGPGLTGQQLSGRFLITVTEEEHFGGAGTSN